MQGDNNISPFESKLWSLHYHILFKFKQPVIFKYYRGSPRDRIDSFVIWFIPDVADNRKEIESFIRYEMEKEEMSGKEDKIPGCDETYYSTGFTCKVLIYNWSNIRPYMERDESEVFVQAAVDSFNSMLSSIKRKQANDHKY